MGEGVTVWVSCTEDTHIPVSVPPPLSLKPFLDRSVQCSVFCPQFCSLTCFRDY